MTLTQAKKIIVGVLEGWFPNKKVLDKLNEVNGKLYYNGIEVSLNSLTEEDVQQAITSALAELNNKVKIEREVSDTVISETFINDYTPIGTFVITDRNIVVTYDNLTDAETLTSAMNDMARFFGTLHENGIVSIKYNSKNYIWNEELGLQDSNWIEEENSDNTEYSLIKIITNDFENGNVVDNKITLFFDDIEYNYSLAQSASTTTSNNTSTADTTANDATANDATANDATDDDATDDDATDETVNDVTTDNKTDTE